MTHERDPYLRLDAAEARCEPSKPCAVRARCARYVASLPKHGAKLDDWTAHDPSGGTYLCGGYLDAASIRKQPAKAAARKVHPPIAGLTDKQELLMQQQATLILAQHKAGQKLAPDALRWAQAWAFKGNK